MLDYIGRGLEQDGFRVVHKCKVEIKVFPRSEGYCGFTVKLPSVGSDYLVEVIYKGESGECVRRVVEAARKVEGILANLFEPRSFLDVIKEIGVGTTGFFFKLSGRSGEVSGEKSEPFEVTIRIGIYTVVKLKIS